MVAETVMVPVLIQSHNWDEKALLSLKVFGEKNNNNKV